MQTVYPKEEIKTVEDLINFLSQFPKIATVKAEAIALPQGIQLHYVEEYDDRDQPHIELIYGTYYG